MLELNFKCESTEDAAVYLNAQNYHNLLSDLYAAIRSAQEHGTDAGVLARVEAFMPDIARAIDHNMGAY